jgi:hypothetical protein
MNLRVRASNTRSAIFLVLTSVALSASLSTCAQQACTAPAYRQFDFWIGDWEAFDVANPTTAVAHVRVERILDGCALQETYEGANGVHGQSFSIYDQSRGVWHQSWVTNRGQLLTIEGKMQAGAIILTGSDRTADGKRRIVRGTWKPAQGGVRETAITSTDNGATWAPWFDLLFRPRVNGALDAPTVSFGKATFERSSAILQHPNGMLP